MLHRSAGDRRVRVGVEIESGSEDELGAGLSPATLIAEIVDRAAFGDADAGMVLLATQFSYDPSLRTLVGRELASVSEPALWSYLLEALALETWNGQPLALPPPASPDGYLLRRRIRMSFLTHLQAAAYPAQREALLCALEQPEPTLQIVACELLGERGDDAAVEPLVRLLRRGPLVVREAAAQALGQIGGLAAVSALLRSLAEEHDVLSRHVADALAHIGEPALAALIEALSSADANVRWHAAAALERIRDARAAPALAGLLDDPVLSVRWAAAEALAAMGMPGVIAVLSALETRPFTVWLANGALRVLHHAETHAPQLIQVSEALHRSTAPVEAPVQAALALARLRQYRAPAPEPPVFAEHGPFSYGVS